MAYRIEHIEGKGRSLAAEAAIRAGHTVLAVEPYEASLLGSEVDKRSHLTFRQVANLKRCGTCRFARYASRREQVEAYRQGHKEECQALKQCAPHVPGATLRLMARILWKRSRGESLDPESGGSFSDLEGLVNHWEKLDDQKKLMYAEAAVLTRKFMDPENKVNTLPSNKEIALLYAAIACNSHTICDDENRSIGEPTVKAAWESFSGTTMTFRALEDIAVGEEVTITYIELAQTRPERRRALLERYYFDIDVWQGSSNTSTELVQELSTSIMSQGVPPFPTITRVWRSAPWPLDKADEDLMGLCSSTGSAGQNKGENVKGTGFMARLVDKQPNSDNESACDNDLLSIGGGFASKARQAEQVSKKPERSSQGEEWEESSDDGEEENAIKHIKRRASTPPQAVYIDVWGPGFFNGSQVLEQVAFLTSLGSAWALQLSAGASSHEAGSNCLGVSPESVNLGLKFEQQAVETALQRDMFVPLVPSRLHVLRNRLYQLRHTISQETQDWTAALKYGLELRPFYELVYPKVFPVKAIHEAAIAMIAHLLRDAETASEAAARATRSLKITNPESDLIDRLAQICSP